MVRFLNSVATEPAIDAEDPVKVTVEAAGESGVKVSLFVHVCTTSIVFPAFDVSMPREEFEKLLSPSMERS